MDKRNFIFILLFSLALLAVNMGFSYWTGLQKQQFEQKQTAYNEYMQKRETEQILRKSAQINNLQLLPMKTEGALALETTGAIAVVADPSPAKSIKGLPLASLEEHGSTCALYFKPNNFTDIPLLMASKAFIDSSSAFQDVSVLVSKDGIVRSFPAKVDSQLTVTSPLAADQGGFEPQTYTSGLVLSEFDNQFVPVAQLQGDGKSLSAVPFARFDAIAKLAKQLPSTEEILPKEQLLVLENKLLQLVISTRGGGLAEINLPFKGPHSPSIVAKVENDHLLDQQSPVNSKFPLFEASTCVAQADGSYKKETRTPSEGGYYPLLRRDLLDAKGQIISDVKAQEYALSLVGEYPEVSFLTYKVIEMTPMRVVLEAKQPHRRIQRVYELPQDESSEPYIFNFELKIDGDKRGLWLATGVPEAELGNASPAPVLKYRISKNGEPDIENFDVPKESNTLLSLRPDWICNGNSFFATLFDPITNPFPGLKVEMVQGEKVRSRLTLIDADQGKYKASSLPGYRMLLPLPESVEASAMKLRVFAGPIDEKLLNKLDATYSDPKTNYDPQYRSLLSFTGWFSFILRPFAKVMMMLMNVFHNLTHSWVAAILLLTVALRAMLYPLNAWSNRSMRVMQEISPKVKALQERYKNDPKKLQMETVALYRQHKVNPVSGCLPILIQIPFLFAMLHLFKTNFALRGASFIPGWIDDLAAPDVLFSWGYSLPIIGSDFHLLPILLGAAMFWQARMSGSGNASDMSEAQRQQRAMSNIMTFAFTFMFYSLPSGLNIYWLASSLLGMAQQKYGQYQRAKIGSK